MTKVFFLMKFIMPMFLLMNHSNSHVILSQIIASGFIMRKSFKHQNLFSQKPGLAVLPFICLWWRLLNFCFLNRGFYVFMCNFVMMQIVLRENTSMLQFQILSWMDLLEVHRISPMWINAFHSRKILQWYWQMNRLLFFTDSFNWYQIFMIWDLAVDFISIFNGFMNYGINILLL